MKKIINILLLLVFFVLAFTFAQKNQQLVSINYYAGVSAQTQVYLAVFLSLGIGLVLGYLISLAARLRLRGELKKARQQHKNAEIRLEKLNSQ